MSNDGSSSTDSDYKIIDNKRGRTLLHKGHSYVLQRENKKSIVWVCVNKRKSKCGGAIKLVRETDSVNFHSKHALDCLPNFIKNEISSMISETKKEVVSNSLESVRKIYETNAMKMRNEMEEKDGYHLFTEIPDFKSVKSQFYRSRYKNLKVAKNPKESFTTFTRTSSNQDSIHASGDGDCVRCCRLCGGDTSLKYFRDSYVWEGVEERYDQLLFDCFGVKVTSSDCMICDWCVRALRGTEKFRALVHAAFDPTASGTNLDHDSDASSTLITIKTNSCQRTQIGTKDSSRPVKQDQLVMANKRVDTQKKREVKKYSNPQDRMKRRALVYCELCNQKYPVMISNNVSKTFTCSRCKKNGEVKTVVCKKCNVAMPNNLLKTHMELHVKADIRGRTRLRQISSRTKVPKQKTQSIKGSKKPSTTSRPGELLKSVLGDGGTYTANSECDEDIQIKELQENTTSPLQYGA